MQLRHPGKLDNPSSISYLKISPSVNRLFVYLLQNFAKEFVISDHKELDEDYIKNELKKAGGANYDAQTE